MALYGILDNPGLDIIERCLYKWESLVITVGNYEDLSSSHCNTQLLYIYLELFQIRVYFSKCSQMQSITFFGR